MAGKRDIQRFVERLEQLEEKVNIMDARIEENKRFTLDEIRELYIRIGNLENAIKKLSRS